MKKTTIRPYGDTENDGKVQIAFSLPMSYGPLGIEAAKALGISMGLANAAVVHGRALGDDFSHYIVYGTVSHEIDLDVLKVVEVEGGHMEMEEIEALITDHFQEDIVFIGASTGSDAHTVGIDAIMNMKGYHGHYGLERYQGIKAINLGGQIENEVLLEQALKHHADVILISQTVTQKDVHILNLTAFVELLEAEGLRDRFIVVIGGPRVTHALAKELGYDAGFGPGKYANDVAAYAVRELIRRKESQQPLLSEDKKKPL